ncbi:CmaU [Candidatus Burkholderia verschuerenii]|uniref:CmaU n=2 Tax=Candidatus Burkholderia verschuerenii TaxID=242163 RepID=A0A0L0MI11_9BURK|nr:CmaU [Candidatus Burkholderia verschuerenii]
MALQLWLGIAVLLITPGPTNTLLAAAGMQSGARRAMPLIMAELAGYLASISAWGWLVTRIADGFAWVPLCLRILSVGYVAILAVRMWRASAQAGLAHGAPVSMRSLFVATLLNPKAMLFASAIFPAAAFTALAAYLPAMSLFTLALLPVALGWIMLGAGLGRGRRSVLGTQRMYRIAAFVLGLFALWLALSLIQ